VDEDVSDAVDVVDCDAPGDTAGVDDGVELSDAVVVDVSDRWSMSTSRRAWGHDPVDVVEGVALSDAEDVVEGVRSVTPRAWRATRRAREGRIVVGDGVGLIEAVEVDEGVSDDIDVVDCDAPGDTEGEDDGVELTDAVVVDDERAAGGRCRRRRGRRAHGRSCRRRGGGRDGRRSLSDADDVDEGVALSDADDVDEGVPLRDAVVVGDGVGLIEAVEVDEGVSDACRRRRLRRTRRHGGRGSTASSSATLSSSTRARRWRTLSTSRAWGSQTRRRGRRRSAQ
jgi:hypothetical protein